jgi:protein ImuB
VLIVRTANQRELVGDACAAARRAGVCAGMTVAHARALLSGRAVVTAPEEPAKDRAGLESLARWAVRWSPVARADPPDGLLIDITGCAHLFGGEPAMARSVASALARLRLSVRVAVASTIGAAWAMARFGPSEIAVVQPGEETRALEPLPISALRLEPAAVIALGEVGVQRIGQLLALPREALPARYGDALVRRVDEALGARIETVISVAEPPPVCAIIELPGGATQWEAVASATRRAVGELCRELDRRCSGARRVDAVFTRLDARPITLTVRTGRASRSAKHLWRLMEPAVERLNLGFGIEEITLRASGLSRLCDAQSHLIAKPARAHTQHEAVFSEALDTLMTRLGPDRLLRPTRRASHRPERASAAITLQQGSSVEPACGPILPRPSHLFVDPRPARVTALSPDGPVITLAWSGGESEVIRCLGPERLSGEWWRAREPARDYFRVQDRWGRWLWLFREDGCGWFVHGEWR